MPFDQLSLSDLKLGLADLLDRHGDALGALLRARGDLTPASRKSAATERSATVGLLNQFRAGLACEFPPGSKKLAAFDRTLFGYFDTLEAHRAAGATTPVPAPDPSPPATENPIT